MMLTLKEQYKGKDGTYLNAYIDTGFFGDAVYILVLLEDLKRSEQRFCSSEEANEAFKKLRRVHGFKPVNANEEADKFLSNYLVEKYEAKAKECGKTGAEQKAFILTELADNIMRCASMSDAYNTDYDAEIRPAIYAEYLAKKIRRN